jgi:hypothetical protein
VKNPVLVPAADAPALPACPWCGGVVVADVGLNAAPGLDGYGRPVEVKTLGRRSLCTGCEFGIEGTWTGVKPGGALAV